jgi:hypothetical protein
MYQRRRLTIPQVQALRCIQLHQQIRYIELTKQDSARVIPKELRSGVYMIHVISLKEPTYLANAGFR